MATNKILRVNIIRKVIGLTGLLMVLVTTPCRPPARFVTLAHAAPAKTTHKDPLAHQVMGHMGSPGLTVAVQGKYAYLGGSAEFTVVDVSEPHHPRSIWQDVISVNDIVLSDDVAFIGGRQGIYLYDLSTPRAPRRLRFLPTPSAVLDLELVGRHLYAAVARHGVLHMELHDRTDLLEHGFIAGLAHAQSLAAHDTNLLVAGEYTIALIDLADPQKPRQLSTLSVNGRKKEVVIDFPLAFVAGEGGLWTVALDVPEALTIISVAGNEKFVHGISVSDSCTASEDNVHGCIYLAAGMTGLCLAPIFDRSVGANLGCRTWAGSAWGVAVADGMLYIADGDGGLVIFSEPTTDDTLPVYIGSLHRPGAVWRLAANADSLFVQSGWYNWVQSVQTDEQLIAHSVDRIKTADIVESLTADAHRLCLVSRRGLAVFEIGESLNTGLTGFLAVEKAVEFALDGDIGHLLTSDGTYLRIDLRVPQEPSILAETALAERASDLIVTDESVYVAVGSDGVALVRTDERSQQTVQFLPIDGYAVRLAASEQDLYVGTTHGMIHHFSIADSTPSATGRRYELDSSVQAMVVIDDLLIAADEDKSVQIFDIGAAGATAIKTIQLPFPVLDLAIRKNILYIADGLGGLFWLETDRIQISGA